MTAKRKTPAGGELAQQAATKAQADRRTARVLTDGTVNAAVVQQYLPHVNGGGDVTALADLGGEQARAVGAGDLGQLERMLLSQATALQAMFVDLACRGKQQKDLDSLQVHTALALKCATASRQAITALVELRAPKSVLFARQANLTTGPQQINNGVLATAQAARAEKFQNRPSELSAPNHELLEDTRASRASGRTDPRLETVGAVHRAEDAGR